MLRARNVSRPNPAAKAVIEGRPAPSYAVVGQSELESITAIANEEGLKASKQQFDAREALKKSSQERVANWPNTIEAQRIKKERARRERLEAEEARRLAIDGEETALKATRQELAIRKANLQLYEENDRVKNFSSKLFLATVLEERSKQVTMKAERDELADLAEKRWALINAENLRKAQEEEETKVKKLKDRAHHIKGVQLEQLDEVRKQLEAQRDNEIEEGKRIAKAARDAVMEERLEDERRRERQKAMALELVEANHQQQQIRDAIRKKDEEEAERIEKFAASKEQQMLERKKRVDQKFATKLLRRQELIDRQAQLLADVNAAVEEREMKQLRDFERERQLREEREANARKQMMADIHESRQRQLQHKRELKQRQSVSKTRMQDVWRNRAEALIDEELEERQGARDAAEKTQRFQLLQVHEKKRQVAHEKQKEIEEGIALQRALKEEEDTYTNYVNAVMTEYVKKGQDAGLVQLAVQKARSIKTAP